MRHRCDLIQTKYETELKHFNTLSDLNTNDIDDKKQTLEKQEKAKSDYKTKVETINTDIEYLQKELEKKEESDTKLKQLLKMETKIEHNLHNHKKNLEFFQENDNCPTCTQPLEPEFRGEKIATEKGKITVLEDGIKKLNDEVTKMEEKVNHFGAISKKLSDLYVDVAKVNTSLEELNNYSEKIHQDILQLENKQTDSKKIAVDLQQLKEDLEQTKLEREKIATKSISEYGTGGMKTKIDAAKICQLSGCKMVIANGLLNRPIKKIIEENNCTWFLPKVSKLDARKKWIISSISPKGALIIDDGAKQALSNGKSLLAAGVKKVSGRFRKGDHIKVLDKNNLECARGLSSFSSDEIERIMGHHSREIEKLLGYVTKSEVIHKDDIVEI